MHYSTLYTCEHAYTLLPQYNCTLTFWEHRDYDCATIFQIYFLPAFIVYISLTLSDAKKKTRDIRIAQPSVSIQNFIWRSFDLFYWKRRYFHNHNSIEAETHYTLSLEFLFYLYSIEYTNSVFTSKNQRLSCYKQWRWFNVFVIRVVDEYS